jgi:hypothetical protein
VLDSRDTDQESRRKNIDNEKREYKIPGKV